MTQLNNMMKSEKYQQDKVMTGCLLDFAYFEKKYRLTAADLSKQKVLGADSRTIQQITFKKQQRHKSFLHSQKVKRNHFVVFKRNNKSVATTYK